MSRMLRFLMSLALLASMGLGVAAHANEQMCIPGVEATAVAGHVDGDADQVPADSEKGYPHHHGGCHGHHVAAPLDRITQAAPLTSAGEHMAGDSAELAMAQADSTLRPPIA
ncbi:hypothetical protein [Sphingomonas sp. IC-56]|uniref:hypothetical protein n=1 Tax=Sphingomonas sp. IC-56 TaxID=2898529 RepID=UPI003FA7940B